MPQSEKLILYSGTEFEIKITSLGERNLSLDEYYAEFDELESPIISYRKDSEKLIKFLAPELSIMAIWALREALANEIEERNKNGNVKFEKDFPDEYL